MSSPANQGSEDHFEASRERFEAVVLWLEGEEAIGLEHSGLEAHLEAKGRELLRQLFQDQLDLRASNEVRIDVVVTPRGSAEARWRRTTNDPWPRSSARSWSAASPIRRRGQANLHPADAALNLPAEKHSHGLRRLAALEASRGSFDGAVEAIERSSGQALGKRQVESLAERSAVDFDDFYEGRKPPPAEAGDVVVLSCDGKGIVMRPEALRAATAKAAAEGSTKLHTRLSKGEKRNRKRMVEVGSVHDITPVARTPADILPGPDEADDAAPGPVARGKWLMASVAEDAASVVSRIFDEAERRDPGHRRHGSP